MGPSPCERMCIHSLAQGAKNKSLQILTKSVIVKTVARTISIYRIYPPTGDHEGLWQTQTKVSKPLQCHRPPTLAGSLEKPVDPPQNKYTN